jgi:hypothetical protein
MTKRHVLLPRRLRPSIDRGGGILGFERASGGTAETARTNTWSGELPYALAAPGPALTADRCPAEEETTRTTSRWWRRRDTDLAAVATSSVASTDKVSRARVVAALLMQKCNR